MCGGVDRLLVYSFVCKPGDNATVIAQQVGRPLPTSYGAPNGTVWLPAEEDFTLQEKDSWFYNGQLGVRTPAELRTMYETSSGGNTGMIISIGPFANGSVSQDQAAAAAALGTFVRRCYGAGKAVATTAAATSNKSITITPAKPSEVDRIQIREDQSKGQLVREFHLTAKLANGTIAVLCPKKTSSIGNKFICVLDAPLTVTSLSLALVGAAGTAPRITQLAAFRCGHVAAEIDAEWRAE